MSFPLLRFSPRPFSVCLTVPIPSEAITLRLDLLQLASG